VATDPRQIGGSVGVVLTKSRLDRFHLGAGNTVNVVESSDGLLITPFDPDFADAMTAYARDGKKFRRATRQRAS